MPRINYDVIIAGAGVAGAAAAAALKDFGWSVLIAEPGQQHDRRLAGELIHPTGIAGLAELGLLRPGIFANAASIRGFVAFPDFGTADNAVHLPYPASEDFTHSAVALEHARIRQDLLSAIDAFDHVTVKYGARVVGLDQSNRDVVGVSIKEGDRATEFTCRIVVAADGATSAVRALAGIGHRRTRTSTLTGHIVDRATLPMPGHGHVFIGAEAPVLAYPIGQDRVRVMFDQPVARSAIEPRTYQQWLLQGVPSPLRTEIAAALGIQRGLSFATADVFVEAAARGRVALVGDAGGSCHPLTATGMTACIGDSLRLRDALRERKDDLAGALALYARRRRGPQRARLLVGTLLHQICSRKALEARTIRAGLVRYWRDGQQARRRSMAILAMFDNRLTSAALEMAKVAGHALLDHFRRDRSPAHLLLNSRVVFGMFALILRQVALTIRAH
jgi:squalene monooxygenase